MERLKPSRMEYGCCRVVLSKLSKKVFFVKASGFPSCLRRALKGGGFKGGVM